MDIFDRIPRGLMLLTLGLLTWAVLLVPFAFAQDASGVVVAVEPTAVVFDWGNFLAILLANLADPTSVAWTAFGLAMTWLVAQLPGPAKWAFNVFKVDQLLQKALIAAMNSTKGAVAGKSLDVDVGSEVLAKMLQYAIDNGQKWLIDWMGGVQGVEEKAIARMQLAESVDGSELVQKSRALGTVRITDPVPEVVTTPVRKRKTATPAK